MLFRQSRSLSRIYPVWPVLAFCTIRCFSWNCLYLAHRSLMLEQMMYMTRMRL